MNIKKFYKFLQGVYYFNSKNKVLNFKDIVNIKKQTKIDQIDPEFVFMRILMITFKR